MPPLTNVSISMHAIGTELSLADSLDRMFTEVYMDLAMRGAREVVPGNFMTRADPCDPIAGARVL